MQYEHMITPSQRQFLRVCPLRVHVRQRRRREEGSDLDQRSPESKFTSWVGIRSTLIGFDRDPIGSVAVLNGCVILSRVWEVDSSLVSSGWISTV